MATNDYCDFPPLTFPGGVVNFEHADSHSGQGDLHTPLPNGTERLETATLSGESQGRLPPPMSRRAWNSLIMSRSWIAGAGLRNADHPGARRLMYVLTEAASFSRRPACASPWPIRSGVNPLASMETTSHIDASDWVINSALHVLPRNTTRRLAINATTSKEHRLKFIRYLLVVILKLQPLRARLYNSIPADATARSLSAPIIALSARSLVSPDRWHPTDLAHCMDVVGRTPSAKPPHRALSKTLRARPLYKTRAST